MRPIFKTMMLLCQSKANLYEKISFGKVTHLDPTIRKTSARSWTCNKSRETCGKSSKEFVWESRNPRSILFHDL